MPLLFILIKLMLLNKKKSVIFLKNNDNFWMVVYLYFCYEGHLLQTLDTKVICIWTYEPTTATGLFLMFQLSFSFSCL